MTIVLKPKRTGIVGKVPTVTDLADGELAVNSADKKIYLRDGDSVIDLTPVGGGTSSYIIVTTSATLSASVPGYIATISANTDFPLPATITAGDRFSLTNSIESTAGALARIVVGAGRRINRNGMANGDNLRCKPGERIALVAKSSTLLELMG